ncbi:MAG: TetR family transcriptional regulator, partial [Desulfuromonadales bacterium]|nr:TetR family transcriptional regulator [Desulfuromonadales bacterium]
MSQTDTKEKILDAAEHLFAQQGYHATSLRAITTTAKVNLAAVNYHFGSKDALLESVLLRRLEPLNQARLEQLQAVLREAEKTETPPTPREVIRTFVEPTFRLRQSSSNAEDFIRLVGHALAEPQGIVMSIFMRNMNPMMSKLFAALAQSLPGLSHKTLFWRLHFAIGSMSHIMRCHDRHSIMPEDASIELEPDELIE